MRFKLRDQDLKNSGLGRGRRGLTPYSRSPCGALWGSEPCRPGTCSPSCRWQPRPQSGVSLAEMEVGLEHTEHLINICGRSPAHPGEARKRGPVPGKSLWQPAGWHSAQRAHFCHSQLRGRSTGLCSCGKIYARNRWNPEHQMQDTKSHFLHNKKLK